MLEPRLASISSLADLRYDLELRAQTADIDRGSSIEPRDVYWNGFYWGIQVALGLLSKYEEATRDAT